jgi:hypothetical protein
MLPGMQDSMAVARRSLKFTVGTWMRGAIEFTKKSMGLTKEVAPSQVFDFSFAAKALGRSKN